MTRPPNINRISVGDPNINDNDRTVYIISRFVSGAVAAWGANAVGGVIGALVPYPNPYYHWAICVGDWYHQLQATEARPRKNYYDNDKYSWTGGWGSVKVGTTKFNDIAIVFEANKAILDMSEDYNLLHNNCQTFALKLADLICRDGRKKVFTSSDPTTRKLGFIPGEEDGFEQGPEIEIAFVEDENEIAHMKQLATIQKIMRDNTPTLTREEVNAGKFDLPEGFVDRMPNEKLKEKGG